MNKKNVIFIMIACLIVLTASFGITYAYLISSDSEINEFVVGENTIKVVEEFDPPEKLEPGTKFCEETTGSKYRKPSVFCSYESRFF